MESIIVGGIGAAALGYIAYVAWRGASGKGGCGCGNACTCKDAGKSGSCCSSPRNLPK